MLEKNKLFQNYKTELKKMVVFLGEQEIFNWNLCTWIINKLNLKKY